MTPARIRKLREKMQISRERMAELVGVSARTVEGWENGKHPSGSAIKVMKQYEAMASERVPA